MFEVYHYTFTVTRVHDQIQISLTALAERDPQCFLNTKELYLIQERAVYLKQNWK
jgi:hypothetical protein